MPVAQNDQSEAPFWDEYVGSSPERLLRYKAAPGLVRRRYFDTYTLPGLSGTPAQINAAWEQFNADLDGDDASDPNRADIPGRVKATINSDPIGFEEFVQKHLNDQTFTPEQYRDDPRVRGMARDIYMDTYVLPNTPIGGRKSMAEVDAEARKLFNEIDRRAGRVTDDLMPDPATAADRSGLPSLTPTNLNTAPGDGSLTDAIARKAGRTLQAEEPGVMDKIWSYLADAPVISGAPGLQRQARKVAPVETQRRLQIGDIAREELVGRLTQGGMSEENANVMLNSPRGQQIVRDTAKQALLQGAKLANQGDATWSRLVADMKHSADRMTIESMRKLSYAMLKRDMITREEAQALWQSGEEMISQIPESLDRGFWGNAVTDVAGMGPILTAGGLLAAVPGVGPVLTGLLFAAEAEGGFYHYAIEEAGLPEDGLTKSMTLLAGGMYGALESLQLKTITTVGKRGLIPAIETAIKNSTLKMQKKLALRSGARMTEATAEQMLQEGAQQMVDELHKQFADQEGIDWGKVFDEGLKAARESFGASVILTGGFGLPAHAMQSQQLRSIDASMKEAAAEVARSTAENKSAAEQKLAVWKQKSDALRASLGLIDAPLTTEGGPLPAPEPAQQAEQPTPPPAESFTIDGQDVVPGLKLQGPDGPVEVVAVTPDPETGDPVTVVKNAAGEEIALGAQGFGGYKAVPKKAPQPAKKEAPASLKIGDKTYTAGDALVNRKTKAVSTVTDTFSDGERQWVVVKDKKTGTRTVLTSEELGGFTLRKAKPAAAPVSAPKAVPAPTASQIKAPVPQAAPAPLALNAAPAVTPNFVGVEGKGLKPRDRIYQGETPYKVFSMARDDQGTVIGAWIEDGNKQFTLVRPGDLASFTQGPKKAEVRYAALDWTPQVPSDAPIVQPGEKAVTDAKPPVTDRTMRLATKGLPIINGEPVRLRDTLYRDGKPYRVFRMLDDSKGKVYAIEFEGLEKPVTLKELKAFSRKLEAPVATPEAEAAPEPAVVAAPAAKPARKPRPKKQKAKPAAPVKEAAAPEAAAKPEAAKPEPAKAAPAAKEAVAGVGSTKRANIFTDESRFQMRDTKFASKTAESIEADFKSGKLTRENYLSNLPPIIVWKDPKNGKLYVLDGHSRLEGLRRAGITEADPINYQEFKGTEAEAIAKAEELNDLGTSPSYTARAKVARRRRESFKTAKEYEAWAKRLYGKDWQTIDYLSYLNPGGATMEALRRFHETTAEQEKTNAQTIASWIGAARKRFPALTDAHETEMLKFLNKNFGQLQQAKSQTNFVEAISRKAGSALFNPNEALVLEKPTDNAATAAVNAKTKAIRAEIEEAKAKLKSMEDRLESEPALMRKEGKENKVAPEAIEAAIADFLAGAQAPIQKQKDAIQALKDELNALVREKIAAKTADASQGSMFDVFGAAAPPKPQAPKPAEAAKAEVVPTDLSKEIQAIKEAESELRLAENAYEKQRKKYEKPGSAMIPPPIRIEVMGKAEKRLADARKSIQDAYQAYRDAEEQAAPPTVESVKSALESGTYESAKPAVVALGRQIIADGHTTLAPFTRRLKELLGDTYAKLKGKIKEIYEAAKSDAGFLRLPARKKPEGKDNQRGAVRKFARRMLTRDGGKTAAIADLADLLGGQVRAERMMMDIRARDFRKALKAGYGKNLTKANLETIHEALTGPTPLDRAVAMQAVPAQTRPAVKAMRDYLDELSTELIASGAVTDPELAKIIASHAGQYMTRSYRIFGDAKYLKEVLNAVSYIGQQGSGKYGATIGKRVMAAADYIRDAYTIPASADLQTMAWPDLLSLAAHRGIDTRGRKKADIIADLDAAAQRVPSDEWIRQQLTDLLQKAKKAGSNQSAFRVGRIEGQMDLSSMMRRNDIPEALRDMMGEHKDPLVNFYRSGLRISQQIARHRFMESVVSTGMKNGIMFDKPTTAPDPFAFGFEGKMANYDTRMGNPNDPSTAPFANIYTSKEIADALQRAVKPMEAGPVFRWILAASAATKLGKTVLSIDTTVRNFMGNPYFALMQGHLRGWEMVKAGQIAGGQWIKGQRWQDTLKILVREGVIGDSAYAQEMGAMLSETFMSSDDFESFRATLTKKIMGRAKGALGKAQDTYQMMDDIWKIYGYIHEYRRYEAVGKKKGWTADQVARQAAYVVKNVYPSYSQLPEIVQWIRRIPMSAPFVSFPAAVLRVHYMTGRIAAEELQDADTRHLGMIRIAGLMAMPLAYYSVQELSKYMAGMNDDDDEAARSLLSPFERDGLLIYSGDPRKTGSIDFVNLSYTVGGAYMMDPLMSLIRGAKADDWGTAITEAVVGLTDPFVSEDMLAAAYMDLSRNKTGRHRPIYNATEAYTLRGKYNIAADVGNFMRERLQPGVARSAENIARGWREYQNIYGKRYTLGGEISRTFTGVSPVSRDITGSAIAYAKSYKALMGESVQVVSNRLKGEDPSDQDIRDAVLSMETSRQVFWVRTLEIIDAARRFGKTPREIRTILDAAGFTKQQRSDLLAGRYHAWRESGQFMEALEEVILAGPGGKKGAAELARRRKVASDYAKELKSEDLGILPEGIRKR